MHLKLSLAIVAELLVLRVSQEIQQPAVTAGDDVTLTCTFTSDFPVWTGPEIHDGFVLQYNNNGQSGFLNPNLPQQKESRLDWGSDKCSLIIRDVILNDKGLYQCSTVAKINLSVRVPPFSPVISNTELSASGVLIIRASQSRETSLVCISSSGYPQQQLEWFRGNTGTQPLTSSATVNAGTNSFNVTQTYTFSPKKEDDGIKYICQSSFETAPRHILTSTAELLLSLKPNSPTVQQTSIVSAGNQAAVRCTTTGTRPAANTTWAYKNNSITGEQTTTLDGVTKTYTVVSLLELQVTAADNGQSVQCKVSHTLIISPAQLTVSTILNVTYPPIVSADAINTTVIASIAILRCITKGNPDSNYSYGKWIQRWPGYNKTVSQRSGSETLVLSSLTYEHSGFYTCSASNGIKVVGADTDFVEGMAVQLLVKSFPIIISLNDKIASRLNKNVTIQVDFFSNVAHANVKLYKIENGASYFPCH